MYRPDGFAKPWEKGEDGPRVAGARAVITP